jgi:hypothetical protein
LIFQNEKGKHLLIDTHFLDAWDKLYDNCPWSTIFQSKDFVLTWYQDFEAYPKIIVTDWDGQKMTGLLTLTAKNNMLTAAGLDMAEYQAWLGLPHSSDEFLKKALYAISKTFPKTTLYLKYLTGKVPLNLFLNEGLFGNRTILQPYVHPLMATNEEVLEAELKKKNKKEKINRLKRLGDLEFFEIKEINHFRALIDEMALQSDFRKGAFYNKTIFHEEPERKKFLLRLFELGLLHVSALSVHEKLIAFNAGFMGPDMVHLQGINGHSPYYSKYSPGILQFLMLGIFLKKSGIKYFDLTPGGADGYKSVLATETNIAYEFWFTSEVEAKKKKILLYLKNWLKPRVQDKSLWGEDLSNLNLARMRLKLKLRFTLNKLKYSKNLEFTHFLENDSIHILWQNLPKIPVSSKHLSQEYTLRENHIPDLFLFDETRSFFPRMDLFADCIVRMEYGQTMFSLTKGKDLLSVCWFIPISAKSSKTEIKESFRPATLLTSYFNDLDTEEMLCLFLKIESDFLNGSVESLNLEIGKNQRSLLKLLNK